MAFMKKSDVQSLANLARLELTDEELESYTVDLNSILGYVDQLKDLDLNNDEGEQIEITAVRNIFREDLEPHKTGLYTDDILSEAQSTHDSFIKVKKILNTNDSD